MSITTSAGVTEEFSLTRPSTWSFRAAMIRACPFFSIGKAKVFDNMECLSGEAKLESLYLLGG